MRRVAAARNSIWFLPAVLGALALVLAQSVVSLDRAVDGSGLGVLGTFFYRVGASGSRDILGAIGGSMLGVAATSFSITISVLATTSSTYGPRLVRNFMADRGNQFVLGMFGATFLYCLVVLRSIRDTTDGGGTAFVPDLAVNLAVVVAVVDVGVLVYFIHHIADSVQVSSLIHRVRRDLLATVARDHPREPAAGARAPGPADLTGGTSATLTHGQAGFVTAVDEAALLAAARQHDAVLEVLVLVGDHVLADDPVVRVRPASAADGLARAVRRSVDTGPARTPEQDLRFAVQQLVELGVRGLATGTNDPWTAVNALTELGVGLVPLASRPVPLLGREDADGVLRLVVTRADVPTVIGSALDTVRHYATDDPQVVLAAVALAARVVAADPRPDVAEVVAGCLQRLEESVARRCESAHDVAEIAAATRVVVADAQRCAP